MNTAQPQLLPNSFDAVMRNQRRGAFLTDLSDTLQKVVLTVKETGQSASLSITLKFDPASGDGAAISVRDEIKTKLPEPKKPNTLFYSTDDGRLVREDPNQKNLDLRVAEAPTPAPLQTISTAVNQ